MVSARTKLRRHMRETNPEGYEEYLEKARQYEKKNNARKKRKISTEEREYIWHKLHDTNLSGNKKTSETIVNKLRDEFKNAKGE